jgi:signal transduction histidine kinase
MKESSPFPKPIQPLLLFLSRSKDLQSTEVYQLYVMIMIWGSTAILMWSYSLNSFYKVGNYFGLSYLCFIYSLIHLFSPLFYKVVPSIICCTYLFLIPGFLFQFHHAMATGGFYSNTIIWFSLLPLIVGVTLNTKHMLIWVVITLAGVIAELILTKNGYSQDIISEGGRIWAQINIATGYIMINLFLFLAYVKFRDDAYKTINDKKSQVKNLLRILVHDISNPLTLIKFSGSQIKKSDGAEKIIKQTNYLDLGVQSIEEIINYVREYEALESNKEKIILEKTDLNFCVSISLTVFESKLKEKLISVNNQIAENQWVIAEKRVLITQVLNNLFSNCIKFTNRGGQIEIFSSQKNETILLHIKDNGVGIEEERLSKLFEESKSTSTPGTEGERGTGFGMPIVKVVMSRFQAKIEVKSTVDEKNHGTEYILSFKKNNN